MKRAVFAAALLVATGVQARGTASWRPTMEADPAETGAEGFIYMNELGKAYEVNTDETFCKFTRESFQEHEKYTIDRYKKHDKDESARKNFRCFVFKKLDASRPAAVHDEIANFTRAGFALSDLYCRNFFRRMALHNGQRNFTRSVVNDVGTAVSAILGLASAGSAVTGAAGAAFGASDSAFRNYDQQFTVGADLASVERQVLTAQDKYKIEFFTNPLPDNYFDAAMAIQAHANFCSYVGMKMLINAAVDAATTKEQPLSSTDVYKQLADLQQKLTDFAGSQKGAADRAKVDAQIDALRADIQKLEAQRLNQKATPETSPPPTT